MSAPLFIGAVSYVIINRKYKFGSTYWHCLVAVIAAAAFEYYVSISGISVILIFFLIAIIEELAKSIIFESSNRDQLSRVAIDIGTTFGFMKVFAKLMFLGKEFDPQNINSIYGVIIFAISVPLHGTLVYAYNEVRKNSSQIFSLLSCTIMHLSYNAIILIIATAFWANNLSIQYLITIYSVFSILMFYVCRKNWRAIADGT